MLNSQYKIRLRRLSLVNIPFGIFSLAVAFLEFTAIKDQLPLLLNAITVLLGPLNYAWLLKNYPIQQKWKLVFPIALYLICLFSFLCIMGLFFAHLLNPDGPYSSKVVFMVIGFQLIDSVEHFVLKVVDGQMRISLFRKGKFIVGGAQMDILRRNLRWINRQS